MHRKILGGFLLAPKQALRFVPLELLLGSQFGLSLIAKKSSLMLGLQELEYSPRPVYEARVKT